MLKYAYGSKWARRTYNSVGGAAFCRQECLVRSNAIQLLRHAVWLLAPPPFSNMPNTASCLLFLSIVVKCIHRSGIHRFRVDVVEDSETFRKYERLRSLFAL